MNSPKERHIHLSQIGSEVPARRLAGDKTAREGTLQAWPRPAIPEFMGLVAILGEEIHALVQGIKPRAAALADLQGRCEALLRSR